MWKDHVVLGGLRGWFALGLLPEARRGAAGHVKDGTVDHANDGAVPGTLAESRPKIDEQARGDEVRMAPAKSGFLAGFVLNQVWRVPSAWTLQDFEALVLPDAEVIEPVLAEVIEHVVAEIGYLEVAVQVDVHLLTQAIELVSLEVLTIDL